MSKVYLIGAGPGDPGLLTLKGAWALKEADVVLYDDLVNPDLLRYAKPGARLVRVGKRGGTPSAGGQNRIHRIFKDWAGKNIIMARLKGGDPYLFGRGAEEGQFLKKIGVSFEVIPGITSGMACPAYAGIPLTDRHLSSSVAFVTGHGACHKTKKSSKETSNRRKINWKALAEGADTLVVYMGLSKIRPLADALLKAGLPGSRRAAVIERGTCLNQRTVEGTLADIASLAIRAGCSTPAILIVGDVISLRKRLNWHENLPLFGKKIVLTRSEHQTLPLREELERLGAQVFLIQALEIRNADTGPLDRVIPKLKTFDWIVFTSPNGVERFFERLKKGNGPDARSFGNAKIAAVGSTTRDQLAQHGIRSNLVPRVFTTEALFGELRKRTRLKGERFLLLRSEIAPPELRMNLEKNGAQVVEITAYRALFLKNKIRKAFAKVAGEEPDCIVFTSSSTVNHLLQSVGRPALQKFFKKTRAISIGPVTSGTLRAAKLPVHAEARPHTGDGLKKAILTSLRAKRSNLPERHPEARSAEGSRTRFFDRHAACSE